MARRRKSLKTIAHPTSNVLSPIFPGLKGFSAPESRNATLLAIDAGANHAGPFTLRQPQRAWKCVPVAWGKGASSCQGVSIIPTVAAARSTSGVPEVKFGVDAVELRSRQPDGGWQYFRHLKLVLADQADTKSLGKTLQDEREVAKSMGLDIESLAVDFFVSIPKQQRMQGTTGRKELGININDLWSNANAQRVIRRLEAELPGVEVIPVDETFAAILGLLSQVKIDNAHLLVLDFGHSTTNIARAVIEDGALRRDHAASLSLGAGIIEGAVEEKIRQLSNQRGDHGGDISTEVAMVTEHISEYFKPHPEDSLSPPSGFRSAMTWQERDQEWQEIMAVAVDANMNLDRNRLSKAKEQTDCFPTDDQPKIILATGRASHSPTLRKGLNELTKSIPNARLECTTIHEESAVIRGLQEVLVKGEQALPLLIAPLSIWVEHEHKHEESRFGVRLVRKGQALIPDKVSREDRDLAYPMPIDLEYDTEHPEICLNVYGTPGTLLDEDIITDRDKVPRKRRGRKRRRTNMSDRVPNVYAPLEKLTKYGEFTEELHINSANYGECTVYLWTTISMLRLKLYAVFASDGHPMPRLESCPMSSVLDDGKLTEEWSSHNGKDLKAVYLGQVARMELANSIPSVEESESNKVPDEEVLDNITVRIA